MRNTITEAKKNVEKAIGAVVEIVEIDDEDTRRIHEVEARLWSLLLALGRSLIALYLSRRASLIQSGFYEYDRGRYFISKGQTRSSEVGTIFGKVTYSRPYGRPISNGRGAADLFLDRALGLVSGFSLMVVLHLTRLSAQMPFARARETFRSFVEWAPSPRATLRMVDALGPHALEYMLKAPSPDDDGEVLVIECDAGGNPTITPAEYEKRCQPKNRQKPTSREARKKKRQGHEKRKRAKGKKSKNSKAAIIGVVYTLRVKKDGTVEGPQQTGHRHAHQPRTVVQILGSGCKKTRLWKEENHISLRRQRTHLGATTSILS